MALKRKIRQIGNSVTLVIPNEIFEFLGIDASSVKYKLCQDDTGCVFIVILEKDVIALDEKKFQKRGGSFAIIIPKTLCTMWNVGFLEGQVREMEISFDELPLKWRLSPV